MNKLVCVQDFEDAALEKLDKNAGDYFKSGSDDEITLRRNKESYNKWIIRPHMLRDVSQRNLRRRVQGKRVEIPIGFSPAGFQGLASPEGEVNSAKAAASMGTIYVHSTYASRSIEDVAKASPNGRKWFQLFPNSQEGVTIDLVKRAEEAGYEAIVITLDAQKFGNKRIVIRNGLNLPPTVRIGNLVKYLENARKSQENSLSTLTADEDVNDVAGHAARTLADKVTWDIIPFIRKQVNLPIILKGILTPEDTIIALRHKVAGIWVSNHGGRQIDTAPQPIDVLPEIADIVNGQCEIYIDSGIRKGSDVFKALALGATMAFVGRPQIWGNAIAGEDGARQILTLLKEELDLTMALSGVADVKKITRDYVCRSELISRL